MGDTIFGKILRGEAPCSKVFEDDRVLVFKDIAPVSDHHLLVIPKGEQIRDASKLRPTQEHISLVKHMVDVGRRCLRESAGTELSADQYSHGFHWPPVISVKHLHLHCIAPARKMSWYWKIAFWKNSWWYRSPEWVLDDLAKRSNSSL